MENFRGLNCYIKDDCYQLTNIKELTSQLLGKTIFSKIDLIKDYHQIPVFAIYIPKTEVANPFGHFKFLHIPFGLANTA